MTSRFGYSPPRHPAKTTSTMPAQDTSIFKAGSRLDSPGASLVPVNEALPTLFNPIPANSAKSCRMRLVAMSRLLIVILLTPLLAGCLSLAPLPTATPSPLPATDTPTFVIPPLIPTTTWTPVAVASPTVALDIGVGDIIFIDDFEEDRGWDLEEDIYGATALTSGRLTLATKRPGAWRFALSPMSTLTDFYMEISLRADICSSGDEFGLMFRFDPLAGHYRFGLRCDGGARVSRIVGNSAFALIPRHQTDIVVPGPPQQNRLAIWAQGNQFRFFINQVEMFSARDSSLFVGSLGLYVFSGDAGQTTVSFDDLIIRSLIPAPIETATPSVTEETNGS
jgi:hypothetical protein